MRKLLLTGVLGLALIMGACSGTDTREADNINFYTAKEKNLRDNLSIEGKEVRSEEFAMNLAFEKNMIKVAITNTSDDVIIVDWEHARYTGLDNNEQRIFNMKQKDKGLYTRQMAIPLRPGQSYTAEIVPVANLHYTPGGSTGLGTIYIEKDLFTENKERDYAKLEIPVTVGGIKKGVIQRYEVYFGEAGEMPADLVKKIEGDKDLYAAPVVPAKEAGAKDQVVGDEALKIQSENDLLEQEIKAKEDLIEQLNEKARLQKELEERQREIDALMQQLN